MAGVQWTYQWRFATDAMTEEEQIAIYDREADDTCRRLRDKALQLVWLFKRREPSTQLEIDNCIYDRDHCNWKLGQLQRRRALLQQAIVRRDAAAAAVPAADDEPADDEPAAAAAVPAATNEPAVKKQRRH